jgi:hypothetical protein
MRRIRQHLTYANVMTTITAFVVLAGGTAFAAGQLAKNSVGKRQLKSNAVTTAKIKRNAVTKPKIKNGAVDGSKIKNGAVDGSKIKDGSVNSAKVTDGSLTETDINVGATPFSRIVYKARGNGTVPMSKTGITSYPLSNGAYTQEAGRTDMFTGALDVTFDPTCTPPRAATAIGYLDPPDPSKLTSASGIVAVGVGTDETGSKPSVRISMGPYLGASFEPATATSHNLVIGIQLQCTAGDGAKATFGAIDVIGAK